MQLKEVENVLGKREEEIVKKEIDKIEIRIIIN